MLGARGCFPMQSKLASAVEALANTALGFALAFVAQSVICWAYSIQLSNHDNAILVWWMTVVSVVRSYVVRRLWNVEFWKGRRSGN